jgi:hypothetical protein
LKNQPFFCDIKFYYLNISVSRVEILSGKPDFPTVVWGVGNKLVRPRLGSLVTTNSWLLFNLLKMEGTQVLLFFWLLNYITIQDWLLTPCSMWHLFTEFRRLKEFSQNVAVINDIAERVSDFEQ